MEPKSNSKESDSKCEDLEIPWPIYFISMFFVMCAQVIYDKKPFINKSSRTLSTILKYKF